MKLSEAQTEYADAWLVIQKRIADIQAMTDADIVPVACEVTTDKGERCLVVTAMSDLVPQGSEADCSTLQLSAPIDGKPQAASVH